jgi:hypothetical protein
VQHLEEAKELFLDFNYEEAMRHLQAIQATEPERTEAIRRVQCHP